MAFFLFFFCFCFLAYFHCSVDLSIFRGPGEGGGMRVGAVSGRVPSVEFLAPACIPNRTASTISPRCYSSLALQHRLGPLLRYIGTYLNRSCGTALWTVMPSLADLFPEFPLAKKQGGGEYTCALYVAYSPWSGFGTSIFTVLAATGLEDSW